MFRVYIDEAGDRGHHPASSKHFVVSAVIVRDEDEPTARNELATLRATLGRHPGHVLHFRNLTHSQKVKACQDMASFSIGTITNVVFCKTNFAGHIPGSSVVAYIKQADPMYLYAVRLLLERVSWYVAEHGGGPAIVTFAHLTRFPAMKLHNYRHALMSLGSQTEIRWNAFQGHPFRINHPNTIELLQVADSAASALFKAVEPDNYGNPETRYIRELSPKLYRRGAGKATSYGLKVFPTSECQPGGSLAFLNTHNLTPAVAPSTLSGGGGWRSILKPREYGSCCAHLRGMPALLPGLRRSAGRRRTRSGGRTSEQPVQGDGLPARRGSRPPAPRRSCCDT